MDMGSKSDLYELLNKDFRQKIIIYSAADQVINALCGGSSEVLGDSDGRPRGRTYPPPIHQLLEPTQEGRLW